MAIRMSGLISGLDTESIVKELMSVQSMKLTKKENLKTKTEWKLEKWKDLNTKLYSLYTGTLSKMKLQGTFQSKKVSSSNESAVSATAGVSSVNGSHTIEVKHLAAAQYVTGGKITKQDGSTVTSSTKLADLIENFDPDAGNTIKIENKNGTTTELTVDGSTTIDNFIAKCKEAGLNASFDKDQGRLFLSSKESGTNQGFSISCDDADGKVLKSIGLGTITAGNNNPADNENEMSVQAAKDAEFTLDGAVMTSSSNSVSVNGLNLNLKGVTSGETTLTVATDTEGVYNTIKEFIKQYNDILKEMNEAYNGESAKGYDVLTSEQKEAMTDDEVEKWEGKIKGSLLRRDTTLNSLISTMRSSLMGSVKVDDGNGGTKSYSLASFGITTSSDYTEGGLLHIYGDEDDEIYGSEENKLKAALESNPEAVQEVFNKLCTDLYDTMTKKMARSAISSAMTFYNDIELKKQISTYDDDLSTLRDRLQDMEDRYYKQFTAMEKAMSQMQSQSNSLAGLLGGG